MTSLTRVRALSTRKAMDQRADDLLLSQAHIEANVDVQLQLLLGAQGNQRGDGHHGLLLLGQACSGVDVAERDTELIRTCDKPPILKAQRMIDVC